jgi:hypothetical protein
MAKARGNAEWQRTALLATIIFNAWKGEKQEAATVDSFNPFANEDKPEKDRQKHKVKMSDLRPMLGDLRGKG